MNAESTKYFQRVIPMSGSAFNYNAYHDGDHRCLMFAIAKNASYPVDSTQDLIEFLKKIPADQIEQYIQSVFSFLPVPSFWAPVIESIWFEKIKQKNEYTLNDFCSMHVCTGKDAIRPFITEEPFHAARNVPNFNLTSLITFVNRVSSIIICSVSLVLLLKIILGIFVLWNGRESSTRSYKWFFWAQRYSTSNPWVQLYICAKGTKLRWKYYLWMFKKYDKNNVWM